MNRLLPAQPRTPWVPFVIAAFVFTLLVGALNGAINLWSLHVLQRGVPVEHHQSHALAQLFGFMWLFTAGVSFHLGPRLFGAEPPPTRFVRLIAATSITGLTFVLAGRLGRLLPGSAWLGLAGALLLAPSVMVWSGWVLRLFRRRQVVGDLLPHSLLAGAGWWWLAALALAGWQVGQSLGGPLERVPFEFVTATALFGGTASWVFGISFRAGACAMRIERPSLTRQRVGLVCWQLAAVAAALLSLFHGAIALSFLVALGLVGMVFAVRPFQRPQPAQLPDEPFIRPALVAAWAFALVAAAGFFAQGLASLDVFFSPFLRDGTRHAFTLGFLQLAVFGFAGRMLAGFEGVSMRRTWAYDVAVGVLALSAALRCASAVFLGRATLVASGISGPLALIALALFAVSLLTLLVDGRRLRSSLVERRNTLALRVPVTR